MKEEAVKFISEIVKPWELLNRQLAYPFSINPAINDFITIANAVTVAIKHLPEITLKIKPEILAKQHISYEIISDLADSLKHGELRKPERECKLEVSSMFERNSEAKVRFLRNRISALHNTHGKIDFMECAMESALFIAEKLNIKTDWNPMVLNNAGEFSDEIKVHASKQNQVIWEGMNFETVQLNAHGKYENVDLNGEVTFTLTSEF
jgi:hypothetical protein